MDTERLYLGSLTLFGVTAVVDTALDVGAGATLAELLPGAAGLLVLAAIAHRASQPADDDRDVEPWIAYLVAGASTLYVFGAVVTWL